VSARRLRPLTGLLAAALLAAAASASAASALPQRAAGTVAYSSYDGVHSILAVSTEGAGLREVARNANTLFSWSPDGQRLVFSREDGAGCRGCSDLYVVGSGGGSARRLTAAGTNADPAWSPGGELIAFDRCRNVVSGRCAMFVIEPDGRGLRRITPWGGPGGAPVWSTSGRRIAFADISRPGIYVVGANGRGLRRLTRDEDEDPHWAPDGGQIVFMRQTLLGHMQARRDVYVVRPDGSGLRRLTGGAMQGAEPSFSPDGLLIIFIGIHAGETLSCYEQDAVYEMGPTGAGVRRLTGFGLYESPEFSPDEAQIAFIGLPPGACPPAEPPRELYVMAADGSAQQAIPTLSPEAGGSLAWRPEP